MKGNHFHIIILFFSIAFSSSCNSVKLEQSSVSVKEFGAKGDGVTDDTNALQKALDNGGKLFFPKGTYKTQPLAYSSDTYIYGEGEQSVVKLFFKRPPVESQLQSIFYAKNIDAGLTKNVTFKTITLDGSRYDINWGNIKTDGNAHGIATWGTQNISIENVWIKKCWTDGFYICGTRKSPTFYNAKKCILKNIQIENCGRQGISVISCEDGEFKNITVFDTDRIPPRAGIDLEPNRGFPEKIQDLDFSNITVNNCGQGFTINGVARPNNITIQNLNINGVNNQYGIMIMNADDVHFDSVTIDNRNSNSNYSMVLVDNSSDITFEDIEIKGAKGYAALELRSGQADHKTQVVFDKFKILNSKNAGLLIKDSKVKSDFKNGAFSDQKKEDRHAVLYINSSETVFDKVDINGSDNATAVKVDANNVLFKNCIIHAGKKGRGIDKGNYKVRLENTKVE